MDAIIEDKLEVAVTSHKDDYSLCDFKEEDGSDPSGVDDFIHNRAPIFQKYNLCVIYTQECLRGKNRKMQLIDLRNDGNFTPQGRP